MKVLFLVIAFIITAVQVTAQNKLVKAFNNVPADARNQIDIKIANGNWKAHSGETDQDLAIKLNAAGTYLEIKDNGTGGGTTTFQLKLFRDNGGREFIAFNKSWTDGVMHEGAIDFMYVDGTPGDATWSVYPDLPESEFFQDGQSKNGNEEYFTGEYTYCNIPETGNTIELYTGYRSIDAACESGDEKICDLKKKLKSKLVLVWQKEANMFMPAN